jgi:hypothetical protein
MKLGKEDKENAVVSGVWSSDRWTSIPILENKQVCSELAFLLSGDFLADWTCRLPVVPSIFGVCLLSERSYILYAEISFGRQHYRLPPHLLRMEMNLLIASASVEIPNTTLKLDQSGLICLSRQRIIQTSKLWYRILCKCSSTAYISISNPSSIPGQCLCITEGFTKDGLAWSCDPRSVYRPHSLDSLINRTNPIQPVNSTYSLLALVSLWNAMAAALPARSVRLAHTISILLSCLTTAVNCLDDAVVR